MVFLGTSGGVPTLTRNLPAIALRWGGSLFLFDCGENTQKQLMRAKVGFKKSFYIFITHMHGDHLLGLPGLLMTLTLQGRRDPIYIFGPKMVKTFLEEILPLVGSPPSFPVFFREVSSGEVFRGSNFIVSALRTKHTIESYAYRFDEVGREFYFDDKKAEALGIPQGEIRERLLKGEHITINGKVITPEMVRGSKRRLFSFTYTGDTRPFPELIDFVKNTEVLVHDSTFLSSDIEEAEESGHSTAVEAANTAKAASVSSLYLFHISARYKDPKPLLNEARKIFSKTFLPKDLDMIEIR